MICMLRRSARIAAKPSFVMSRPSKMILPAVGSSSRMTQRPSVDLPQPNSPTMPSVSPSSTESVTPSTARTSRRRHRRQRSPHRKKFGEVADVEERHGAHVLMAIGSVVALMQATRWLGSTSTSRGGASAQSSCTRLQRVRNRQPDGQSSGLGTMPGIGFQPCAFVQDARDRVQQAYACRDAAGRANSDVRLRHVSTILPGIHHRDLVGPSPRRCPGRA